MMNFKLKTILYWLPRISCILYALFLTLYILDIFSEGYFVWDTLDALVLHIMPTIVLVVLILIAWRYEWLGAIFFLLMSIFYSVWTWDLFSSLTHSILVSPLIAIAILLMLSWVFTNRPSQVKLKHRLTVSIVFIVLSLTLIMNWYNSIHTNRVVYQHTEFLDVQTNDTLSFYNEIQGGFAEEHADEMLWLIVVNDSVHYHPQPGPLMKNFKKMTWRGKAYVGTYGNLSVGDHFGIYLVSVEANVNRIFKEYITQARANQIWPGFTSLPENMVVLDTVTVIRK